MFLSENWTAQSLVQNLEKKIAQLEKEIADEREANKELREINQKHDKRNAMMDADLKTFKEQHLTAKNKVTGAVQNLELTMSDD